MKQYIEIGKIVGTHAIKGEVRVQPWADSSEFLLDFPVMYFHSGTQKLDILSARVHKNVVVMKIRGVDTVSDADALRGRILYIDRADAKLPEGRYFVCDLLGLHIIDAETGKDYGVLEEISSAHANEIYHVRRPGGKLNLIPAIDDVICQTNIEEGYIRINTMEGMFDDED